MKLFRTLLLGTTIAAGISCGFAAAESAKAEGAHQRWSHECTSASAPDGKFGQRMQQHRVEHLSKLHDALKLNQNQEVNWKLYVDSMQPNQPSAKPDCASWNRLSAPEKMEQRLAHMKQAEQQMSTKLAALKNLYATLTPEQQAIFNQHSGRQHQHRKGPPA